MGFVSFSIPFIAASTSSLAPALWIWAGELGIWEVAAMVASLGSGRRWPW